MATRCSYRAGRGLFTLAAMNRDITPFGLRLPAELKTRMEEAAAKNLRSLNAELVLRIEASERPLASYTVGDLIQELISREEAMQLSITVERK